MRALYQRRKGRDLFDLDYARKNRNINIEEVLKCFRKYIQFATKNRPPSQKEFLQNIEAKVNEADFMGDMESLLRTEIEYNQEDAFEWLKTEVISKM